MRPSAIPRIAIDTIRPRTLAESMLAMSASPISLSILEFRLDITDFVRLPNSNLIHTAKLGF